MRILLRWSLRLLVALALAALVVGLWNREEIARLWTVNTLFDEGQIVENFSAMDRAFLTTPVPRGDGPPAPLPRGTQAEMPEGFEDWLASRAVTGIVVLKDGAIVHENYHLGTDRDDRRVSWSIAKSFLSALLGVLVEQGRLALEDPVTRHAPLLAGSAYDGVRLIDVLRMTSGVVFDEDYLDPNSDINRMGRILALGGSMDGFAAGLEETFAPPGETWRYVSIDTHVIGMVIRGATGRSIPELLSEHIVRPMGLEARPYYLTDGEGTAFVLGGLAMTTRDYARLGLMFAQDGRLDGRRIVPKDWVRASTAPTAPTAPGRPGYGYQWWIPAGAEAGEFMARGVYGQYVWVHRPSGVVIAVNAADRDFRAPGVHAGNIEMFRKIAAAL
jgi:hypothetical protein